MTNKDGLVIVSNRLPVKISKKNGKLVFSKSDGGLATAMKSVSSKSKSVWVGWPGLNSDDLTNADKAHIKKELKKLNCHPVFLTSEQVDNFYSGYCNASIWPLFHYFVGKAEFNQEYWQSYKIVNDLFMKEVQNVASKESLFWIHDYQLMLLPELVRSKYPEGKIGFFLHIPFPSYELFRLLPERDELLKGMLGSDLIGFHTYDYVRHFLSSNLRILGHENYLGKIKINDREVQVDSFPIGIDYNKFARTFQKRKVKKLIDSLNIFSEDKKLILTVDRADYSKGIPARLDAFEMFFEEYPDYKEKVVMILIASPSREDVDSYKQLREEIEQKVSRINGKYSTFDWSPINYLYQTIPQEELAILYTMSDVLLVTPHRDGMNLVAKEYVASRHKKGGVLVLSEMAGVASELPEALIVNPNDYKSVVDTLEKALTMTAYDQKERMRAMQKRISSYDVLKWANDFIDELVQVSDKKNIVNNYLTNTDIDSIEDNYKEADKRLILLDYDGTLKSFVSNPDKSLAHPTTRVRKLIRRLTKDPKNRVIIISGRPKNVIESFFENTGLGLVAEHGGWIFDAGHWVKSNLTSKKWKKDVKPIIEQFVSRTPKSSIEEKDFSLVWHYRNVAPDLAFVRKEDLKNSLYHILGDGEISVFEGNKIIEVKPKNMHKGAIVTELLASESWDFILCMGDDYTDEDMFRALPDMAYTIHVGDRETEAKYRVPDVKAVVDLLNKLK